MAVPVIAQQAANVGGSNDGRSSNCTFNFANGGGNGMSWCVSESGTMPRFASPTTQEHIRVGTFHEGWVLCSGGTTRQWDISSSAGGNGGSIVIAGPAGAGVTTRTFPNLATGGFAEVTNKFKSDTKENDITITMTIKNTSGINVPDVWITRVHDPDNNNDFGDDTADRTARSIWSREFDALVLTGVSFNLPVNSAFGYFPFESCTAAGVATPSTTDGMARVSYFIGDLNNGKGKTVTFNYSRK